MIQAKKFNRKWIKFIKQHGYSHCTEKQCMNIKTLFHWFLKQREKFGTDTINLNCKNLGHAFGLTHDRSAAVLLQRLCDHGICQKDYARNVKNKGHKHIVLTLLVPLEKIQELHDTKILVKTRAKKTNKTKQTSQKNVDNESKQSNLSEINLHILHNGSNKNKTKNVMTEASVERTSELNNRDYDKLSPVLMLQEYNRVYGTLYSLDMCSWWRKKLEVLAEKFGDMDAWRYHCESLSKQVTYNSPRHFSRILRDDIVRITLKKLKKNRITKTEQKACDGAESNHIIDDMAKAFENITGCKVPLQDKKLRAHLKSAFDQCFHTLDAWEKYLKYVVKKAVRNTKGFLFWLLSFSTISTMISEVTAIIEADVQRKQVEQQRLQDIEKIKDDVCNNSSFADFDKNLRIKFIDCFGADAYKNWLHNHVDISEADNVLTISVVPTDKENAEINDCRCHLIKMLYETWFNRNTICDSVEFTTKWRYD